MFTASRHEMEMEFIELGVKVSHALHRENSPELGAWYRADEVAARARCAITPPPDIYRI